MSRTTTGQPSAVSPSVILAAARKRQQFEREYQAAYPVLYCPNHGRRRARRRGLCQTCYDALAKRVWRELTTWEELEEQHLCLPPQKRGRPPKILKPVS